MKKCLVAFGIAALIAVGLYAISHKQGPVGAGGGTGTQFYYLTATTASSSVSTTWSASPVLAQDSSRGYTSFCNDSVTAGQAIYLGMGATSTGVSGIRIAASSCYEMNNLNMFYGNVYAIASPTTATLLTVTGKY